MPERAILTEMWDDDWFQEIDPLQRYLFIYLWTNMHCNQAGLYRITLDTMSFESKLPKDQLRTILRSMSPKVEWYEDQKIVWVRNFLRRQAKSPKFIMAAAKSLNALHLDDEIREEYDEYNEGLLHDVVPSTHSGLSKRECVIIRDNFHCQYCGVELAAAGNYEMDHIIPVSRGGKNNYLNLVAACCPCYQKKLDKTPQEAGLPEPHPTSFHGAQAMYILRNRPDALSKWKSMFPNRQINIESILPNIGSMLPNVGQYQPRIPETRARTAAAANAHANANAVTDTGSVVSPFSGSLFPLVKSVEQLDETHEASASQSVGAQEASADETTIPEGSGEIEECLSTGDREVISTWSSVRGWNIPAAEAAKLVARMRTEFPEVDLLAESMAWAAAKMSEGPLRPQAMPAKQIWNWMKYAQDHPKPLRSSRRARDDPDKFAKQRYAHLIQH